MYFSKIHPKSQDSSVLSPKSKTNLGFRGDDASLSERPIGAIVVEDRTHASKHLKSKLSQNSETHIESFSVTTKKTV